MNSGPGGAIHLRQSGSNNQNIRGTEACAKVVILILAIVGLIGIGVVIYISIALKGAKMDR